MVGRGRYAEGLERKFSGKSRRADRTKGERTMMVF